MKHSFLKPYILKILNRNNLNYDIKEKGEIWLIIGKNLMASGENTGKFTVNLK